MGKIYTVVSKQAALEAVKNAKSITRFESTIPNQHSDLPGREVTCEEMITELGPFAWFASTYENEVVFCMTMIYFSAIL